MSALIESRVNDPDHRLLHDEPTAGGRLVIGGRAVSTALRITAGGGLRGSTSDLVVIRYRGPASGTVSLTRDQALIGATGTGLVSYPDRAGREVRVPRAALRRALERSALDGD